jgi:hypothetical protein
VTKYKVELQTDLDAPIPGRMRAIIEADDSDDAIRKARVGAGNHYQFHASVQRCTEAELADMDGTIRTWLRS